MEELFGGDCNMFNFGATAESDEDQTAGSENLLPRGHGGTNCNCCSDVPIAIVRLAESMDMPTVSGSSQAPDDERPSNLDDCCVLSNATSDHVSIRCNVLLLLDMSLVAMLRSMPS